MKRIKIADVWPLIEAKDNGQPIPFKITFVKKKTGEVRTEEGCTCTSVHSKGSTVNILFQGETSPKSIRKVLILSINDQSIYL